MPNNQHYPLIHVQARPNRCHAYAYDATGAMVGCQLAKDHEGDHSVVAPALAPSSPDAVEAGCTCPDLFNGTDGYGIDRCGTIGTWAIAGDCPIHARNLPEAQP